MDPQQTNPSQNNRQEEEQKKEGIQIPNVFGRRTARLGGRLASRTGSMAGKLATRIATRVGMMAGQFVAQAGAKLIANPWGLLIIGIILLVVLLVILIIMITGTQEQPTLEGCLDENGNTIVKNGNECAANLASYYSNKEGITVTAKCLDKCTDFVKNSCERNASNTCDFPLSSCAAPLQTFCIEYSPANTALNRQHDCLTGGHGYIGTPLGVNSCGTTGSLSPTTNPTPSCPSGTTEKTITLSADSFLAVTETTNYYVNPNRCPPGGPFYNFGSGSSAIISHNRATVNSSCAKMQWVDTTKEAVVSFSGLNIPRNAEIKSATISVPSSGTCQASSIAGRSQTTDTGNFSPKFTAIGNLAGNIQCVPCNSIDRSCRGSCSFSLYCGGYYLPQLTCSNSSGSADILSFVRSESSSQNISTLSFLISPQNTDTYCDYPYSAYTVATGNFTITSPSSLIVSFCSPN